MRVIIIGSGIAGLSAAIALRKVGVEPVVYERAPELREVGAGISLWANALRALDYIGAADSVRAVSLKMTRSEMRGRNGHKVQVAYPSEVLERKAGVPELVRMIHRADLVAALAEHLPAGVAHYGFECQTVELREKGALARFRNGHRDEGDFVIGADGINSTVRAALFGPSKPRYAGYTCWRGICSRPAIIEPGYVAEWWGRGKRMGITTLPDDRVYWWATENASPGGSNADEREYLIATFREWAAPAQQLFATTTPDRIIRNDIIDHKPSKTWSKGRVVLIGDAAHSTTSNLGQGGCMAIEDSVVLARCVARSSEPDRGFEAFTAERFARTAAVTRKSWSFGRLGQWQGRFSCWWRDTMVGLMAPVMGLGALLNVAKFDVGAIPD